MGTAEEIWNQMGGRIDGFTCAAGTGGTLAGVGLGLKAHDESVTIALSDPHGAALYDYYAHGELKSEGSSVAEGIGQGRITANLEGAPIDTQFRLSDAEGWYWVQRLLSEEEKAQIKGLGGFEELMRTLAQRLAEQKERHQGGSKMIGTAGTSPFGAYGYNPDGVRIGQHESRHRRAVKVWDKREFRNLADDVEVGTRNLKIALRKLRRFARTGAPEELDLEETISGTARAWQSRASRVAWRSRMPGSAALLRYWTADAPPAMAAATAATSQSSSSQSGVSA